MYAINVVRTIKHNYLLSRLFCCHMYDSCMFRLQSH